jgi:hypothetical protein
MRADLALSQRDLEAAVAASVPVIVSSLSHCLLDVPYADSSADRTQAERQARVALRLYAPLSLADAYDWEPCEALGPSRRGRVAGVEAAIWAETILWTRSDAGRSGRWSSEARRSRLR